MSRRLQNHLAWLPLLLLLGCHRTPSEPPGGYVVWMAPTQMPLSEIPTPGVAVCFGIKANSWDALSSLLYQRESDLFALSALHGSSHHCDRFTSLQVGDEAVQSVTFRMVDGSTRTLDLAVPPTFVPTP